MAKRSRKVHPVLVRLRPVIHAARAVAHFVLRRLPLCRFPIEVVLADKTRRRSLKRELARTVRRLQNVFGELLPSDVIVVVQQAIPGERELAGCCQLAQRPNRHRFALVRLALQVNGKRLSTDEVLAALTEQLVGLALQQAPGIDIRVPIRLEPGDDGPAERRTPMPPSPLRPLRDLSADRPEPPAV